MSLMLRASGFVRAPDRFGRPEGISASTVALLPAAMQAEAIRLLVEMGLAPDLAAHRCGLSADEAQSVARSEPHRRRSAEGEFA